MLALKECFDYYTDINAPPPDDELYMHAFIPLFEPIENVTWSDDEEEDYDEDYGDSYEATGEAQDIPEDKLEEQFEAVASDGETVTAEQAVKIAHKMGLAPSKADVKELEQKGAGMTKKDVREWLQTIQHLEDVPDNFMLVFKNLDRGDECVSKRQLMNLMTEVGDTLSVAEVDELLRKLNADQGVKIAYKAFIRKLIAN